MPTPLGLEDGPRAAAHRRWIHLVTIGVAQPACIDVEELGPCGISGSSVGSWPWPPSLGVMSRTLRASFWQLRPCVIAAWYVDDCCHARGSVQCTPLAGRSHDDSIESRAIAALGGETEHMCGVDSCSCRLCCASQRRRECALSDRPSRLTSNLQDTLDDARSGPSGLSWRLSCGRRRLK